MTRPVTQVAEVAVNSASQNEALPGCREAKGSVRSRAPAKIRKRNPKIIICAGVIRLVFFHNKAIYLTFKVNVGSPEDM